MSLRANIDHLAAAQGIVAVSVASSDQPRFVRGDERWSPILEASAALMTRTDETSIRLVIGKHTVVVQTEGAETVAVVLPTGHAIAKSLRRMIRRMSRKVRPPLVQQPESFRPAAPMHVTTPPVATQSSSSMEPHSSSKSASTWG